MSHHLIGRRAEVRPAYNSETGERDIWDAWAGCEVVIREVRTDGDVVVDFKNGDQEVVAWSRIKLIGGEL